MTEVCLTSAVFGIQIPVQAPSLRSLFFEKNTLNISAEQWSAALHINTTTNFTSGCYESGFNVGNSSFLRARLGIVNTAPPGSGK